ncbi:hypothetical protein B0H63DRAFT_319332 [Podospora didyma]|uniref:Secreted protein n=1 Tax=Podospora didyma TaxID=330526 RepID=A0AAE0N582_9PEZI|nr:hypothetical protein B0H63DRAFT_319332 [Podospora didyma]
MSTKLLLTLIINNFLTGPGSCGKVLFRWFLFHSPAFFYHSSFLVPHPASSGLPPVPLCFLSTRMYIVWPPNIAENSYSSSVMIVCLTSIS